MFTRKPTTEMPPAPTVSVRMLVDELRTAHGWPTAAGESQAETVAAAAARLGVAAGPYWSPTMTVGQAEMVLSELTVAVRDVDDLAVKERAAAEDERVRRALSGELTGPEVVRFFDMDGARKIAADPTLLPTTHDWYGPSSDPDDAHSEAAYRQRRLQEWLDHRRQRCQEMGLPVPADSDVPWSHPEGVPM